MRKLFQWLIVLILFGMVVVNIFYLRKVSHYLSRQEKSFLEEREDERFTSEFRDKVVKALERIEEKLKK